MVRRIHEITGALGQSQKGRLVSNPGTQHDLFSRLTDKDWSRLQRTDSDSEPQSGSGKEMHNPNKQVREKQGPAG